MKNVKAATTAAISSIILTLALTLSTELSEKFKNFITALTWHHWVSKSVIALASFFIVYLFARKQKDDGNILQQIKILVWITVIAIFVIILFFLFEYFK